MIRQRRNHVYSSRPLAGCARAPQAFADGVSKDEKLLDWFDRGRMPDAPRHVPLGTRLLDAAATMTRHNLHHLLVDEAHRWVRPTCLSLAPCLHNEEIVKRAAMEWSSGGLVESGPTLTTPLF